MSEKRTYYTITPNGSQQMILANIKQLQRERDCVRKQLDTMLQKAGEYGHELGAVYEEFESEESELCYLLKLEEERHMKLMGFFSDGIPF